jgi:hypothetical protein
LLPSLSEAWFVLAMFAVLGIFFRDRTGATSDDNDGGSDGGGD